MGTVLFKVRNIFSDKFNIILYISNENGNNLKIHNIYIKKTEKLIYYLFQDLILYRYATILLYQKRFYLLVSEGILNISGI